MQTHLSAVDHEGAYRNFPVRNPLECATLLPEEGNDIKSFPSGSPDPYGATSGSLMHCAFCPCRS